MKYLSIKEYAAYLDHSTLLPTDDKKIIEKNCAESIENGYGCLCITPATLEWAVKYFKKHHSSINISAAVGFPHGTTTSSVKAFEAVESCKAGANEIDMVMNINRAKEGDWNYVLEEIALVKQLMAKEKKESILKVIVETCLLTDEEKRKACEICIAAGADYIKTSTGFSSGGATIEDIRLFNQISEGRIKIKASGGIKTAESFLSMIDAGASRIGTKFSSQILNGLKNEYGIK